MIKQGILNADLRSLTARIGHRDRFAIVDAGYNTYRLRKEKLLSESSIQFLRNGQMVSIKSLECICRLLKLQPGDIIE